MKPMITWRFRPSHYTVFSIETQGDDWGSPILHHRDDSPPVHLIWTYTPRETAGWATAKIGVPFLSHTYPCGPLAQLEVGFQF